MTRKEILLDVAERCGIKIDGKEAVEFDRDEMANFKKWLFEELKNAGQVPCKDAKYKKDLNKLKERILKDGDTSVSKRDLLERFCEVDKEYNGEPWNLLQILNNINIFIGEEPCEDAVSREDAMSMILCYGNEIKTEVMDDIKASMIKLPPVKPTRKKGKWILPKRDDGMSDPSEYQVRCSVCGFDIDPQTYAMELKRFGANKCCPKCKAEMEGEE